MFVLPGLAQKTPYPTPSAANPTGSNAAFLKKAMEANAAEVQLGQLAQSKSQNQQVKDFGAMMVKDHTKALDRLQDAAKNSGVVGAQPDGTPSPDRMTLSKQDQDLKNRLEKLSGPEFDRAYMKAMVDDHRKEIQEFERQAGQQTSGRQKPQAGTGGSSQAQAVAQELLPTLKMHLEQAESIQKQLGSK
jgi:putative membrane protein